MHSLQGKIFQEKIWHETCFNCSRCGVPLIDQIFAYENEQFFCRICLIEQFARRCSRCNRSIEPSFDEWIGPEKTLQFEFVFFSDDKCLRYEKQFYHQSCFVCNACQQTLMINDFRRRDQSLFCPSCYLAMFGIYCIKCHQVFLALIKETRIFKVNTSLQSFLCLLLGDYIRWYTLSESSISLAMFSLYTLYMSITKSTVCRI